MPKRRDLIRLSEAELDAFLAGRRVMNVATYNHDGTIHLVAMWYGFYEGKLAFETFTKSQKIRNLERDPRITILVEAGDQYEELQGVEIVGTAMVTDEAAVVTPVARSVASRYFPFSNDDELDVVAATLANKRSAVVITPERTVSWDHTKLGGTY
ncbi:MAG: pyridoxamine 5'-phosphate oxidase family protein [Acidimicrobiales bacterium]